MHVAVDDGAADAAVAANVHVRKDDARVHLGVGIYTHILGDNGVGHRSTGDDDAGGDDRIDRRTGAARFAENELGRRILAHPGADGPALVVEVEDRRDRAQVHVGVVIRIERAHIAPVECLLLVLVHKAVGHHLFLAQQMRQDVVAKVVLRAGVLGIGDQRLEQHLGVEDINAHRGIHRVGIERRPERGRQRLLLETENLSRLSHLDNAQLPALFRRNRQRGQRDLGVGLLVVMQHPAVVHLVDLVAGENDHVPGLFAADGIDILVDRVGRAHVPVGAGALRRRQQLEELAQLLGHNARPAFADVPVERQRLVLGEDVNPAQARVDAVGERDVNDAVVPSEGHRRLGAITG